MNCIFLQEKRKVKSYKLWPNGVVPWYFDPKFSEYLVDKSLLRKDQFQATQTELCLWLTGEPSLDPYIPYSLVSDH